MEDMDNLIIVRKGFKKKYEVFHTSVTLDYECNTITF